MSHYRTVIAEWNGKGTHEGITLTIRPCPFPGMNTLMLTVEQGQHVVPIAYFRSLVGALRLKAWMDGTPEPEPPMAIEAAEWFKAFGIESGEAAK